MSEIKIIFSYSDKKIEMNFDKNSFIKDILNSFSLKIEKNIEDLNFLYNEEKISSNSAQKLSELNDKDDTINISVSSKKESRKESVNNIISTNLKFKESYHIICPKCKDMSEIEINNFKISLKNCNNGHVLSGFFLNDFSYTQLIDESKIKCKFCNKKEKELLKINKDNKLLLCSCGDIFCELCAKKHSEDIDINDKNKKHSTIKYSNKEFYCIEHNSSYTGYCHKCKKNICDKCENDKHNKHRIDFFKAISPNNIFIKKLKSINFELNEKVAKFNKELKDLTEYINKISKNIQNDLKILLSIINNVVEDYNLKKRNYQSIQNIKNIYKTIDETPIFEKINLFLQNSNSSKRIGYLLEIYKKMYFEDSADFNNTNFNGSKTNGNGNNIKNEEIKKELIKSKQKSNNELSRNFIDLKYSLNSNKIIDNKIKIFGKKFVENNSENCLIIANGKEYELTEYFTIQKNLIKNNELEIRLIQIKALTDMSFMFHADSSEPSIYLTSISNINNWNTSFVTDISNLFSNCTLLPSIPDISNWETDNLTNISNLFYHCISLNSIPDISKWNTQNIANMSYLFYDCKLLKSLPDISFWKTSKVTDMHGIFCNCTSLISLPDISKWNTENVSNMSGMFHHCTKLEKLPDISEWNTGNVVNMGGMFDHCTSLQYLPDISKWDTKNVTNLNYMFYYCTELSSLPDISQWNTDNVKNMKGLFCNCSSLSIIPDISKWNTSNVTNMSCMFYNCTSLLSLPDLMEWNINKVEDMKSMFINCNKLPKQIIPRKFKI